MYTSASEGRVVCRRQMERAPRYYTMWVLRQGYGISMFKGASLFIEQLNSSSRERTQRSNAQVQFWVSVDGVQTVSLQGEYGRTSSSAS